MLGYCYNCSCQRNLNQSDEGPTCETCSSLFVEIIDENEQLPINFDAFPNDELEDEMYSELDEEIYNALEDLDNSVSLESSLSDISTSDATYTPPLEESTDSELSEDDVSEIEDVQVPQVRVNRVADHTFTLSVEGMNPTDVFNQLRQLRDRMGANINIAVAPNAMNMGDYVRSDEELNNVIQQLSRQGPIARPASPNFRAMLEETKFSFVTDEHQQGARCTICLSDFKDGDEVAKLECDHMYHKQCIVDWSKQGRLCPICRHEMTTKTEEEKAEEPRLTLRQRRERMLQRRQAGYRERRVYQEPGKFEDDYDFD
ncbi:hypothetical protein PCE1_002037 [Barthelona sp. PCE]